MNSELEKSVIDLKNYIENTLEYKKVIVLKNKMEKSSKLQKIIKEIKEKQKEYIKNGQTKEDEKVLKNLEKELNKIPIYVEYNKNLKVVNDMIFIVKEELNEYFYEKINI